MAPVIQKLILSRFRSIPAETVTFDNPTFLVGRNGSGKSNDRTPQTSYPANLGLGVELGALNGEVKGAHYAFEVRAGKNHGFEVVREQCIVYPTQGEACWFNRTKSKFRSNLGGLAPALEPAALGLPVVGGETRFAPVLRTLAGMRTYTIEPAKLREMQDPDSGLGLKPDGSNASSVLQEISRRFPEDKERIGELLEAIVPHTNEVRAIKHGNKLGLEFVQQWNASKGLRFEGSSMSDGTLRALGLLMAVYQRPVPSLIAIEEPEATIHPGALPVVLDLIRHAGRFMQVVVTTHSPDVLEAEWIEGRHLRVVSWQDGAMRIIPVARGTEEAIAEHLAGAGELLRSNALREASPGEASGQTAELFKDVAA